MSAENAPRDALIAFLQTRRWFGDKGRQIRDAVVRDVIPVAWPNSAKPFAVARVRVATDSGDATYQLFIERGAPRMADALEDPEFRRGLADAFAERREFQEGGVRWVFRSEREAPFVAPRDAEVTLATGEQSNSSVRIGSAAILKLFRKLEPGTNPDVEITRFLTLERGFANVPVLLGTITFEDSRGCAVAGMLQELVPAATDAWSYALAQARGFFSASPAPDRLPFEADAERLGEVTRALHEALGSGDADGDFERQPVQPADLTAWLSQTSAMIARACRSLESAVGGGRLPRDLESGAMAIARRGAVFEQRAGEAARELSADAGSKTRVHGDYHLGQVLRSGPGEFFIIDFEGEPARPLAERRARHSPLRDVAGMLRSFAYAAAAASGGPGDERAASWERTAREGFLRGYLRETSAATGLLPQSAENTQRLITLFETEKVFYELQYELDHRPDWVWIPLRGIATLNA